MKIRIRRLTAEDFVNGPGNLCLYVFLFLTSFIFLYRYDHTMFLIRSVFLMGGALAGYYKCLAGRRRFYPLPVFALTLTLLWLAAFTAHSAYRNYGLSDLFYTLCYIGISFLLLQNTYSHAVSLGLYGVTAGSILLRIVQGADKDMILLANSRNYISVLLLSTMLLYYISCHDKKKPVLVTPVLLFFYINIYATGRGGIIVSAFLTLGILLYKYLRIENGRKKVLMGMLMIIVLMSAGFCLAASERFSLESYLQQSFDAFFSRGADSNGRFEIWGTFLKNNGKSLIAYLFASDASLARPDGNLHNSFLQAYAAFGFIGFIVTAVMLIRAFIKGLKEKDFLWLVLFIGLMMRAFTDKVFFQGYCEIYLYYFLLYHVYQKICTPLACDREQ